jgi:hypothetical protein
MKAYINATFAVFILAMSVAAQTPDTSWYASNPKADTFFISTADELAGLAQVVNDNKFLFKTAILTADIDLSAYGKGWNGGKGWIPIGESYGDAPFVGTFDGNGKIVSGLYINDAERDNAGLFGSISEHSDAIVKNLGVVNVEIFGRDGVGGVSGDVTYGGVINCYTTGTINGNWGVGGVVGVTGHGRVGNCYSSATVSGGSDVGGVVGYVGGSSSIGTCYSLGAVSGDDNVGGVAGIVATSDGIGNKVSNCAALNLSVTAASGRAGRVIGNNGVANDRANVAFAGMGGTFDSVVSNGAGISLPYILADGTIGGFFIEENALGEKTGWTIENGMLPGLFGKTVDIPQYLIDNDVSVLTRDRVIPPIPPVESAVVVPPIIILAAEFTAGPNPVAKSAGRVGFYRQGGSVFGNLTVYDVSGNVIRKIIISDKSIGNTSRRLVGSWNLRDAKGRPVPEGTYLARGAVKLADGKRGRVSVVVGVK